MINFDSLVFEAVFLGNFPSSTATTTAYLKSWGGRVSLGTSTLALRGSIKATLDCVDSFSRTNFKSDLERIKVPTLLIHGDADKTAPFQMTGKKAARIIPSAKLIAYENAPQGLFAMRKDKLNQALTNYLIRNFV